LRKGRTIAIGRRIGLRGAAESWSAVEAAATLAISTAEGANR
jgi:hypothetical protein